MDCKKCGGVMVIDEWNGWVWMCFNCDAVGRLATNDEVEAQEKSLTKI